MYLDLSTEQLCNPIYPLGQIFSLEQTLLGHPRLIIEQRTRHKAKL